MFISLCDYNPSTHVRHHLLLGLTMYDLYDQNHGRVISASLDPYHEFPLSLNEFREVNSFTVQRSVSVLPFTGFFAELVSGVGGN